MKTNKRTVLASIFFFLSFSISFAGNYSWTGTTSTDWSTGTNWSPNGTPSTNDSVTITNQTNNPVLAANTTIKRLTMTSGVLDCNGYTLNISALATFNAGTINNGTVTCSGTSTITFAGTTFGAAVSATGNNILFNGSVFNGTLTAVKKGSTSDNGIGNNIFNGAVTLIDSGTGNLVMANTISARDTFNAALTLSATSTGTIYLAHQSTGNYFSDVTCNTGGIVFNQYGSSSFTGNIVLNSSSRNIYFGYSTGSSTLSSGKSISIGGSGFSAGILTLKGFVQSGSSPAISLSLSGSATLEILSGSIFNTNLNVSAPILTLSGARFLGTDSLTHAGSQNGSSSGCYFGGSTYISNTSPVTNYTFTLGSSVADTFATTATINDVGTGTIAIKNGLFQGATLFKNSVTTTLTSRYSVATSGTVTIKGALTLDCVHSGMLFGSSGGTTVLDTSATISLVSGFAGELNMKNVTQNNTTATSFNMSTNTATGNNTILVLGTGNVFNGSFTYLGQRLQLNGSTFNGTASFTRFHASNDASTGGNVFNGTTYITDSVIAHSHTFSLANSTADDFNGSVTFKQYGTSSSSSLVKMYPAYTKNSTFAGNIIVDGTSSVEFGANGGKVIVDGSGTQILSKTGSYIPLFKRIELNNSGDGVGLTYPLTLTDTLFMTKGFIATDTTNLLIVPDNVIVSGASDSSFIVGPVKKVGNDAFTFPLGVVNASKSGVQSDYHPLSISAPSNTSDAYTARYKWENPVKGTNADTTIENESTCEYWVLDRNNGSSAVTVKLGWNTLSCNVFGLDSMRVAVWDTSINKWMDKGNAGTTGTLTSGSVVSLDTLNIFGVISLADKFCTSLRPIITYTDVICLGNNNGTATASALGATPPYTYSWSPTIGGTASVWELSAGTYFVSVTDSRGCTVSDSVVINNPDSILFTLTTTSSLCDSSIGTAKVVPSGETEYYYLWDHLGEVSDSIGGMPSGIYEVNVSDVKGCSVDTTFGISDSDGPEADIESIINVDCFGSNTGMLTIACPECSEEFTSVLPCSPGPLNELEAGVYPVTVNDGGCLTILNVTITQPLAISLEVSTSESTCGDSTGTATISASGGTGTFSYEWSSGGTTNEELNLPSGFDTVIVTDENGCHSFTTVFVGNSGGPSISESKTNNICFDGHEGKITITATGVSPFSYVWYPTGDTTSMIDSLTYGQYLVVVTDSLGCQVIDTISLDNPVEIQIQLYTTDPTTDSTSDGSAHVDVSGGTPPYWYSWSSGGSNSSVSGLADGSYTFDITDNLGCLRSIPFNVQSSVPCNTGPGCYGVDYLPGCNYDPCGPPHNCYEMLIAPYSVAPYNTYPDFGADPNVNISAADECAFEAADQYIRNFVCGNLPPGQTFTLFFPPGQYDIGRQTPYGANGNFCFYARGHNIFSLYGCENIVFKGIPDPITGDLPHIRYIDCLRYGSFVPLDDPVVADRGKRYLPCGPFCDSKYNAFPGDLFDISNSHIISFYDLDIDGNLPNLNVGGGNSSDGSGIIGGHTAIELYDQTNSVFLYNVNIHDFGYVGFGIHPSNSLQTQPNVHVVLVDSKFNRNGCCGLAWESGRSLRALRCQFNENAVITLTTFEASGVDIESESYAAHPLIYAAASRGLFDNCEFKLNYRTGVQNTFQPNLIVRNGETDFEFKNCLFVGHASGHDALKNGNPICISAKRTHFTCCNFVGPINYTYDARINNIIFPNSDETRFIKCIFNEEYTVGGTPFSFTPDCFVDCGNWNATVPHHQYMIHLGDGAPSYARQLFDQCYFKTGYNNELCRLAGSPGFGVGALASLNCQIIKNCDFINTGQNGFLGTLTPPACNGYPVASSGYSGNYMFFQFAYVNFVGNNRLYYNRWAGCNAAFGSVRNAGTYDYCWGYDNCYKNGTTIAPMPTPTFIIPSYYGPACASTGALNLPFSATTIQDNTHFSTCRDRFPDPNPTYDLWGCTVEDGLSCSGMREASPGNNGILEDQLTLKVHPNPASEYALIENLKAGDQVEVYDLLGNLVAEEISKTGTLKLNLISISPGIYLVKVDGMKPQKIIKSDAY